MGFSKSYLVLKKSRISWICRNLSFDRSFIFTCQVVKNYFSSILPICKSILSFGFSVSQMVEDLVRRSRPTLVENMDGLCKNFVLESDPTTWRDNCHVFVVINWPIFKKTHGSSLISIIQLVVISTFSYITSEDKFNLYRNLQMHQFWKSCKIPGPGMIISGSKI